MSADAEDDDARPSVWANQQNPGEHEGESSRSSSSNSPRSDSLRRRNSTNFDTAELLPRSVPKMGMQMLREPARHPRCRDTDLHQGLVRTQEMRQRVDEAQSDSDLITAEDGAKGGKGIGRMQDDSSSTSSERIGRTTRHTTKTPQPQQGKFDKFDLETLTSWIPTNTTWVMHKGKIYEMGTPDDVSSGFSKCYCRT